MKRVGDNNLFMTISNDITVLLFPFVSLFYYSNLGDLGVLAVKISPSPLPRLQSGNCRAVGPRVRTVIPSVVFSRAKSPTDPGVRASSDREISSIGRTRPR